MFGLNISILKGYHKMIPKPENFDKDPRAFNTPVCANRLPKG